MAIDLEPVLDVDDIQGNTLAGFNKDHQLFIALAIHDVGAAKAWLRRIAGEVSSTRDVLRFNRLFRAQRRKLGREPQLASAWFNVAVSGSGVKKLTSPADLAAFPDAFRIGMAQRAAPLLGDPSDPGVDGHPSRWRVGGAKPFDLLLILAADGPDWLRDLRRTILTPDDAAAFEVVYEESGRVRPDLPGHEHFGFKDGISQPGVRGRVSSGANDFLTPRLFDATDPLAETFAAPGQPLVMPGHFVVGYDLQDPHDGRPITALPPSPTWARNGSFLIFRRLRQDVGRFREFVRSSAASLGLSEAQFGAMCVGRWANGAPFVRTPGAPAPEMARFPAENAFAFTNDLAPPRLLPSVEPDALPPASGDPLGAVCPFWSHIRKVNPRDDVTDLGAEYETLVMRMLRRGIVYGAPASADGPDDDVDRGLLFLAYHASIEQSFETITARWMNTRVNPHGDGHDPIVGQNKMTPDRSRGVKVGDTEVPIRDQFVISTGGEYLFSPSIRALSDVLGRNNNVRTE